MRSESSSPRALRRTSRDGRPPARRRRPLDERDAAVVLGHGDRHPRARRRLQRARNPHDARLCRARHHRHRHGAPAGAAARHQYRAAQAAHPAQQPAFRRAISVGLERAAVAARDRVRARIHHAGLDHPVGAVLPRRAHDAEPHRRGGARARRRAGDLATGAGNVSAGGADRAGGGARLRHPDHLHQAAHHAPNRPSPSCSG